ncbi:protein-L-isoaspartate O-methyltransferase [Nocardiopsis sp. FR26]|uniref:protein-L-isoaspartate O-methyltransferase family protein n=1 Tax=Nocardiopsis sp. FR26 TaxID=2605987 RepID=UPI00135CEB29|nr:class I SAM-dependent methyltransferase [Nocardiopsis sp. FR26]
MTTSTDTVDGRMRQLADQLRADGAITSDAVHRAIATTPRHRCVTWFLQGGARVEVPQDDVPPADVLDVIYSDSPLPTVRAHGDQPSSGGSQTSLVARMLEALDLRPGMRVLEIGAGTGYNAALIHAVTGAEVVTVEAGDEAAAGAAAAIERLGLADQVQVLHRDGYAPGVDGPFDRIVATVGIAGVPPGWLELLSPGGMILAPVAHGGYHPAMAITPDGVVRPRIWCDFMPAVGPLRPESLFAGLHQVETVFPTAPEGRIPAVIEPLSEAGYEDLWFYFGAKDRRTTRAFVEHPLLDPHRGLLALVDSPAEAVWVQRDGAVVYTRPGSLVAEVHRLLGSWAAATPRLVGWGALLTAAQVPDPLLVPGAWEFGFR